MNGTIHYVNDLYRSNMARSCDDRALSRRDPYAYTTDPERVTCPDCRRYTKPGQRYDLIGFLHAQQEWSQATFGTTPRLAMVIDHLREEIEEVATAPRDPSEWVDCVLLAFDGARRAGFTPEQIVAAIHDKFTVNLCSEWPPISEQHPDKRVNRIKGARK